MTRASSTNHSFYLTFPSGVDGLFCYWAAGELDVLTQSIGLWFDVGARERHSVRAALQRWVDHVAKFMREKPNGRILIPSFLMHELDNVGVAKVEELGDTASGTPAHRSRTSALKDLTQHAAAFHRAGARSIYQLQLLFEKARWDQSRHLERWWPASEQRSWNLALSFWQTMMNSQYSLGVMDAEREARNNRRLLLDIWYSGASPQSKARRSDRP